MSRQLMSLVCAAATMASAAKLNAVQTDSLTNIRWTDGAKLPIARDHHATFTVGAGQDTFLYVIGGTNYKEMYAQVAGARIQPDGSLRAWMEGAPLPFARGGLSAVAVNGAVVVTGGQVDTASALRGLKRIADVIVAKVQPDGRLGSWQAAPPLPRPRFHHPMVAHNGWVYVVGGQGDKEAESGVFGARVNDDGSIAEWKELQSLPRARSHHAAFVADNQLYVVGGLDGMVGAHNAHFFDVIRAPVKEDGSLGDWRIVSRAPNTYATHAAFAHAGYLWIVGGVENGAVFTDAIWRAPVGAEGRIGAWTRHATSLPLARGHVHNTPIVNDRIYSAGGRVLGPPAEGPKVVDAVHIGELK